MQDYDKIPVDDGDGAGAGRQRPTKKESRPIAWARKHFNDCCGCVGDCVACPIKWALGVFGGVIILLIVTIILLAIFLPKMGVDPAQVMETGAEMITAITGKGSSTTTTKHRIISSALLSQPWASASLPSLDGSVDLPPTTTSLTMNVTWRGINAAQDLKAIVFLARRRADGTFATLGGPSSLVTGAHTWPCNTLSGLCASLTTAWSNGDTLYVVLLNTPPPANEANILVTGLVY